MIIHSHETTHKLVSYYGSIRQSETHPDAMPESVCVFVVCVKKIF